MKNYLKETKLLDFSNGDIQELIEHRQWRSLEMAERLKAVYNYVRDEIKFGYNISDDIPASKVLDDGYGQCNTKSILLMALLRALDIPNRVHGFFVHKALQKGVITGIWYKLAPQNIVHSWVEVLINDQWYILEGVIVDKAYLIKLQKLNKDCQTTFCGYGVYTNQLRHPPIDWNFNDTYIQDKGISQDLGVFDTPDEFYAKHQQQLRPVQKIAYKYLVRPMMNRNVKKIRSA
ncbi:MAG: transglutaminase [Flavobacteriia bacterium]|nr:MAG: transglutaminase [Flavobacteriia bacterium]